MEYERLAYDIALRSLERQERGLEELRARTGVLLGAASLAVSFLGAEAFDRGAPAAIALLALVSFMVVLGASVYILLPDRGLSFDVVPYAAYERLYPHRKDLAEVYRRLAFALDAMWRRNDDALQSLKAMYRLAAVSLAAELVVLATLTSSTLL